MSFDLIHLSFETFYEYYTQKLYVNYVPSSCTIFTSALGPPANISLILQTAARIRHHGQPVMADVLYILSSAMSLLRRCRVNAALTIQLFSQLFHYINMWLFNKLVLEPQLGLCTRAWGRRLRRRLGYVEAWAEKQGLELAADCHLCRIVQVSSAASFIFAYLRTHNQLNSADCLAIRVGF